MNTFSSSLIFSLALSLAPPITGAQTLSPPFPPREVPQATAEENIRKANQVFDKMDDEKNRRDSERHYQLGIERLKSGDLDGAIGEFRTAIHWNRGLAEAHIKLGDALARKGDREGAIEEYRTADQINNPLGSQPTVDSITLRSNIEKQGIPPLKISLRIDHAFGDFNNSTLSSSGPAEPQITRVNPQEYEVVLNTEGVYSLTAKVINGQGKTLSDTMTISVLNKAKMQIQLKGIWEAMRAALLSGDVEKALSYFVDAAQDRYRKDFADLNGNIHEVFSTISDIELYTLTGRSAECGAIRIENGTPYAYPLAFVQDQEGEWKIMGF